MLRMLRWHHPCRSVVSSVVRNVEETVQAPPAVAGERDRVTCRGCDCYHQWMGDLAIDWHREGWGRAASWNVPIWGLEEF